MNYKLFSGFRGQGLGFSRRKLPPTPYTLTPEKISNGQVALEFTFCMVIVVLFMWGFIQAVGWVGVTFAERRAIGDQSLISTTAVEQWRDINTDPSPLTQLQPNFYRAKKMELVFNQW